MYQYILLTFLLLISVGCPEKESSINDFYLAHWEIENEKEHVELADVMNALKRPTAARVSESLIHYDTDHNQKWLAKFRKGDHVIILMDDGSVTSE